MVGAVKVLWSIFHLAIILVMGRVALLRSTIAIRVKDPQAALL
jgi:hypothetical protein